VTSDIGKIPPVRQALPHRRALRLVPALGAVLLALLGLSACGGGIPGDAVVQVGGTSISKTAFDHWMGVASASTAAGVGGKPVVPEPPSYSACIAHLAATAAKPAKGQKAPTTAQFKTECEQEYKSEQQQVLGFLISSDWVIKEAEALGVSVSDAEVHKHFVTLKNREFPTQAKFEAFLARSGETVSDLLLNIKAASLLPQKIEAKIEKQKATVTQAQVAKYYNENKSKFGTPEKRAVEIILTKTEAAAKSAKKEVESGKSFASVAKRVSIDPTSKANGGLLPEVVKGEEEKALDEAIFSASKNVLSGPVKTPFGYYVFEVKSTTPGTQQTLAQSKAAIKQQLIATGQQKALSTFVEGFRKRWTAKTDCRAGYVVTDCKQYKKPKTSSTSTSTGSTEAG
jgi:foldase protein PrsA